MTEKEENVVQWAFNLAASVVAGDYNLPRPMTLAINGLQDAVWELAREHKMSDVRAGCSKEFLAETDAYWDEVQEMLTKRAEDRKMTIGELKMRLSAYPDDYTVVLDTSRDYQEYSEASKLEPCECRGGFTGLSLYWDSSDKNAVLLT